MKTYTWSEYGMNDGQGARIFTPAKRYVDELDYDDLAARLKVVESERNALAEQLETRDAYTALAERLKANRLSLVTKFKSGQIDQLTADLEELKLRFKMEAECHEQTAAELERLRAGLQKWADWTARRPYLKPLTDDFRKLLGSPLPSSGTATQARPVSPETPTPPLEES